MKTIISLKPTFSPLEINRCHKEAFDFVHELPGKFLELDKGKLGPPTYNTTGLCGSRPPIVHEELAKLGWPHLPPNNGCGFIYCIHPNVSPCSIVLPTAGVSLSLCPYYYHIENSHHMKEGDSYILGLLFP